MGISILAFDGVLLACLTTTTEAECSDDENFLDEYGNACSAWAEANGYCYYWANYYEFSEQGISDLLEHCKKTCDRCPTTTTVAQASTTTQAPTTTQASTTTQAPVCPNNGALKHSRCWYMSNLGGSCASTCSSHGLKFYGPDEDKYYTSAVDTPMVPVLLGREPSKKQHSWGSLECYVPDEDRYHTASETGQGVNGMEDWKWNYCQLACPCSVLASLPEPEPKPALSLEVSSVRMFFEVPNLDYNAFVADQELRGVVELKVREAIASEAGQGVEPYHVELDMFHGSGKVLAQILGAGIDLDSVRSSLSTSAALLSDLEASVRSVPGISNVFNGTIHIISILVQAHEVCPKACTFPYCMRYNGVERSGAKEMMGLHNHTCLHSCWKVSAQSAVVGFCGEGENYTSEQSTDCSRCGKATENIVLENLDRAIVGNYGGTCTCPNGETYLVGDNSDGCGSLACFGGKEGACAPQEGAWSNRKVVCQVVPTDNDYCLQSAEGWLDWRKCSASVEYCVSWAKDMQRCCPDSCGLQNWLSEEACNELESYGKCVYPIPREGVLSRALPTAEEWPIFLSVDAAPCPDGAEVISGYIECAAAATALNLEQPPNLHLSATPPGCVYLHGTERIVFNINLDGGEMHGVHRVCKNISLPQRPSVWNSFGLNTKCRNTGNTSALKQEDVLLNSQPWSLGMVPCKQRCLEESACYAIQYCGSCKYYQWLGDQSDVWGPRCDLWLQPLTEASPSTMAAREECVTVGCPDGTYIFLDKNSSYFCMSCPRGRFGDGAKDHCDKCPLGKFADSIAGIECKVCPVGSLTKSVGATNCELCPSGRFAASTQPGGLDGAQCAKCPIGRYADDIGASACKTCALGRVAKTNGASKCDCQAGYSSVVNSSTCIACEINTYSLGVSDSCIACPRNSVTTSIGSRRCVAAIGFFMVKVIINSTTEFDGSVDASYGFNFEVSDWNSSEWEILACDHGKTTRHFDSRSRASCICGEGTYYNAKENVCLLCPIGLECRGDQSALGDTQPVTLPGYFLADDGGGVYECFGERERCIGGNLCAEGRHGITCALCKLVGHAPQGTECIKCTFIDRLVLAMLILCIPLLSGLCYWKCSKDNDDFFVEGPSMMMAVVASQLVSGMQVIRSIASIHRSWGEPFELVLQAVDSVVGLNALRASCLLVSTLPEYTALITPACVGLGLLSMAIIHIGRATLGLRTKLYTLIHSCGTLITAFFIPLTSAVVEPFICDTHPNSKKTMRASVLVLCEMSNRHYQVLLSLSLVLALVLSLFLAACLFAGMKFKSKVLITQKQRLTLARNALDFLRAARFLFFRFRPDRYWFVLLLFSRSFFVPTALLFDPIITMTSLQIGLAIYAFLVCLICPWALYHANILDTFVSAAILVVLCIAGVVLHNPPLETTITASTLAASVVFTYVVVFLVVFSYAFYRLAQERARQQEDRFRQDVQLMIWRGQEDELDDFKTRSLKRALCIAITSEARLSSLISSQIQQESERGGISVAFLISPAFKEIAEESLARAGISIENATFYDLKNVFFYGENALGRDTKCPRDGLQGCALIDFFPRECRRQCTHFLSWCWGYKVMTVLEALALWVESVDIDPGTVFLYCCFFVNNQYRILHGSAGHGAENLEEVFERRLKSVSSVIALLDTWDEPTYLTRVWTVFEQYTAYTLGVKVTMILPRDSAASLIENFRCGDVGYNKVIRAFAGIDVESSKAFSPEDETKVKEIIRGSVGFHVVNRVVLNGMMTWVGESFQKHVSDHVHRVQLGTIDLPLEKVIIDL